jgi:hypothetical protein
MFPHHPPNRFYTSFTKKYLLFYSLLFGKSLSSLGKYNFFCFIAMICLGFALDLLCGKSWFSPFLPDRFLSGKPLPHQIPAKKYAYDYSSLSAYALSLH